MSRFVTPGTNRKFGVAERKGSIHSFVSVSTMGGGARNSVFENPGFSEAEEEGGASSGSRSSSGSFSH